MKHKSNNIKLGLIPVLFRFFSTDTWCTLICIENERMTGALMNYFQNRGAYRMRPYLSRGRYYVTTAPLPKSSVILYQLPYR